MTIRIPFVIRAARPDDRTILIDLQRRASIHWSSSYVRALIAYPEMIDVPLRDIAAGRVVVVALAEAILGFATVLPRDDGAAELDAIFVEPAEWRQGIGRRLIEAVVQMALDLGARRLDVIANPQAEGFYLACGFIATGTVATAFAPALTMTLRLDRTTQPWTVAQMS